MVPCVVLQMKENSTFTHQRIIVTITDCQKSICSKYLFGEISSHENGTKIKVEFLYPDHIYLIFVISIVIAFAELFSKGIIAAIPLFVFVILLLLISNTLNKNLERELEDSFERIVGEYIISKEGKI